MNLLSPLEREKYLEIFSSELKGKKLNNSEIILCPPFVHIEAFNKWKGKKIYPVKSSEAGSPVAKFDRVKIGGQDVFSENKGSFTGEISPPMLKGLGCDYVIVGHSERRRYFAEKNEEINLKLMLALKGGLLPILCVGETKIEKENHHTLSVISSQVKEGLFKIGRVKAEQIVIAYEPVWSVGTDEVPTANEIMEARVLIKKILVGMFGKKYAEKVRIVYGGSVNSKTVQQVCVDPGMDGVLIGRESLVPYEFLKIAEIISKQI